MEQAWLQVQDSLKERLGAQNYEIWIQPIQVSQLGPDRVSLQVPNRYYRDWVQDNYGPLLTSELRAALGHPVTVSFQVARRDEVDSSTEAAPEPLDVDPIAPPIPGVALDKTFGNFVVGACNQFAHAAAQAVADVPGDLQYNPLFIYGGTGLGKTHLMHAIGNSIRQNSPDLQVLYVTAEQFTNELIDALRYRRMPEFRDKYRKQPGVLLLDDVQFVSGKDRTQEELFHTFNWLKERGRQIVFTADVLPREIKMFEPRLRTRCESGMLADTQPPDMETMLAILRQKAEDLNLEIQPDLAQYITSRLRGNVRELEGVLNRLMAISRLYKRPPSIELAQQHMGDVLEDTPAAPTAEDIIQLVANFYNVKTSDLRGPRRFKQLVRPRHVAMFLIKKHTQPPLSYPVIGRDYFGNRDHATVQHACKKVRQEQKTDPDLRNAIRALERSLGR